MHSRTTCGNHGRSSNSKSCARSMRVADLSLRLSLHTSRICGCSPVRGPKRLSWLFFGHHPGHAPDVTLTYPNAHALAAPAPTDLGVYVHFPWCLKKCPYCDFLSVAAERPALPHAAYADTVIAELERRVENLGEVRLVSVFFGGGTPSLWEPAELGRVLARIRELLPNAAQDLEVTVECNPTSFDVERGRALQQVGVNRVSIGVQGLDAE